MSSVRDSEVKWNKLVDRSFCEAILLRENLSLLSVSRIYIYDHEV